MYFKDIKIENYNYKFIEDSECSDNENEILELESNNIFIKNDEEPTNKSLKYSETSSELDDE